MAERDRASVDVEFLVVEMQLAVAGQDLRGEGFVEFDQIEVGELEAVLLLEPVDGGHGADAHDARVDSGRGCGEDSGERLQIISLDEVLAR